MPIYYYDSVIFCYNLQNDGQHDGINHNFYLLNMVKYYTSYITETKNELLN